MFITPYIKGFLRQRRGRAQLERILEKGAPDEIRSASWPQSLKEPNAFYETCVRYFHTRLPAELREHRHYFSQEKRGFGEEAFHVMWYLLFREFKFRNFLEIGVYRGQTLSLAGLLQRQFNCPGELAGISPFTNAGDSVGKYIKINYHEDTLKNFDHFSLPTPTLIKAFSTDELAKAKIKSREWDCIYIDGNHDYEIARQDWDNSAESIRDGGVIVLDDSALSTSYRALDFATAGFPGPSRLAAEINTGHGFEEILHVGHNRVFQKTPLNQGVILAA
jgi:hypothetical protein